MAERIEIQAEVSVLPQQIVGMLKDEQLPLPKGALFAVDDGHVSRIVVL